MAGLYDLLRSSGRASDEARVDLHMLESAMGGYVAGVFATAQIKSTINSMLTAKDKAALSGSELTDLDALVTNVDAIVGKASKYEYIAKVWAVSYGAEIDDHSGMTETFWRSNLDL